MSNYKTKEEISEDLFRVYTATMKELKLEGVMVEDKQGLRVSPKWVVIKESLTLLNRMGMIESVHDAMPQLDLE